MSLRTLKRRERRAAAALLRAFRRTVRDGRRPPYWARRLDVHIRHFKNFRIEQIGKSRARYDPEGSWWFQAAIWLAFFAIIASGIRISQ